MRALLLALVACSGGSPPPASPVKPDSPLPNAAPTTWPVPAGWKSEIIPFPLSFAPGVAHRGVEELRFPPGMFKQGDPGYWSYAFVWRTEDVATIAAPILAAELTAYFRGLLASVDEKKQQIKSIEDIVVKVTGEGEGEKRFAITARVLDAFTTAQPVELTGWAQRFACPTGALWVFVFSPEASTLRGELDALAAKAACGQTLAKE
jgi:hypothetical protein